MLKAIFIDHMGTLVYEQSEYLEALLKKMCWTFRWKGSSKDCWFMAKEAWCIIKEI